MTDPLASISDSIATHVATVAPGLVALMPGTRAQRTAFAWQDGIIVTSEQGLPDDAEIPVRLPDGARVMAHQAGRDPGTNVAILRLDQNAATPADSQAGNMAPQARPGAFAFALGAAEDGPAVSFGVVHSVGPAWDSMAGGRIDQLIRLDLRLPSASEGGPVLDASGGLLGMSTFGPRRRVLVIPAATIRRVVPGLRDGTPDRGWLGLGLQPVGLPASMQQAAGRETGLMVMSTAPHGPAERAGILPGDILLDVNHLPAPHPRAVAQALMAAGVGQTVPMRLLRAGAPLELPATIAVRPAA